MLYNSVSLRLYSNFIAQFFRKLGKRARPVTHAVFFRFALLAERLAQIVAHEQRIVTEPALAVSFHCYAPKRSARSGY